MQQADCAQADGWLPKQAMRSERRGSPRAPIDSLVYVDLQPNNGGVLLDLNMTGLRISAAHRLTAANLVRFSFGLSPSATIEGTGQVSWVTESGKSAGICFVDVPESSLTQIRQWLGLSLSGQSAGPNEPAHTSPEAVETQITDEAEKILRYAQSASDFLAPLTAPSVSGDGDKTGQAEINATPGQPTSGQVLARPNEKEDEPVLDSKRELASETSVAWLASSTHALGHPDKTEEIAVPQESLTEDRGGSLWAAAGASDSVYDQNPPATAVLQRTGMQSTADPIGADPEYVPAMGTGGFNDPLPVFTLRAHTFSVSSTPHLATQVVFRKFGEIGWGFERDWHVRLGTLLLLGGFAALWPHPPMLLLGIGLWIAGGLILADRKQPPADEENPGKSGDK